MSPKSQKRLGFTLLELLLVMAILGAMLGAGVGVFASLDLGRRQASGFVKDALRGAQNSAVARQAPARVLLDRERGRIGLEALEILGTWRFERQSLKGADDAPALAGVLAGGARFVEDGFLGAGVAFDGSAGSAVEIPVQRDPACDLRRGFAVECALRRDGAGGGQALAIGEVVGIDAGSDGQLRGWFVPRIEEGGVEKPGARVLVESRTGLAPTARWVRVRLEYDRVKLRLSVDGVPAGEREESAEVWRLEQPMRLSGKRFPFHGTLDDLILACVVASDEVHLPDSVRFGAETPADVWFAPGGGLDPLKSPAPVVVVLEHEDGLRESVYVGAYGTVDG
jgi:prepilin-type N-terminal cleavage/methylation domain-containing protein